MRPDTAPTLAAVPDLLNQLSNELINITGLGVSMRRIGQALPKTDLAHEEICPEVVFPALVGELLAHVDACFTTLESLEWVLGDHPNDKAPG